MRARRSGLHGHLPETWVRGTAQEQGSQNKGDKVGEAARTQRAELSPVWTLSSPTSLPAGGTGMCLARVQLPENFKDSRANRVVAPRGSVPSSAPGSRQPPPHLTDSHPTPLCWMEKLGQCVLLCTVSQFWGSRHLSHPAADCGRRRLDRIRRWPLDGEGTGVGSPQLKECRVHGLWGSLQSC